MVFKRSEDSLRVALEIPKLFAGTDRYDLCDFNVFLLVHVRVRWLRFANGSGRSFALSYIHIYGFYIHD